MSKNKIAFDKKVLCPIRWHCKALNKTIEVSQDAIFHPKYGWICDCGQWVKETDPLHTNMFFGKRFRFIWVDGD
jgi:hypothetical protein